VVKAITQRISRLFKKANALGLAFTKDLERSQEWTLTTARLRRKYEKQKLELLGELEQARRKKDVKNAQVTRLKKLIDKNQLVLYNNMINYVPMIQGYLSRYAGQMRKDPKGAVVAKHVDHAIAKLEALKREFEKTRDKLKEQSAQASAIIAQKSTEGVVRLEGLIVEELEDQLGRIKKSGRVVRDEASSLLGVIKSGFEEEGVRGAASFFGIWSMHKGVEVAGVVAKHKTIITLAAKAMVLIGAGANLADNEVFDQITDTLKWVERAAGVARKAGMSEVG